MFHTTLSVLTCFRRNCAVGDVVAATMLLLLFVILSSTALSPIYFELLSRRTVISYLASSRPTNEREEYFFKCIASVMGKKCYDLFEKCPQQSFNDFEHTDVANNHQSINVWFRLWAGKCFMGIWHDVTW